jgi:hypothetical protein
MKIQKIILVTIIVFIASASCTKFEDGPIITFRSKSVRLVGTWKYESRIDLIQNQVVTENLPQTLYTYAKDGIYSESTNNNGTWRFSGAVDLVVKDTTQVEVIWEIIRLSNKELWLRKDKIEEHFLKE